MLLVQQPGTPPPAGGREIPSVDVVRKAINQVYALVRDLLTERMPLEAAEALADKLTTGTWTHDYPTTAREAKTLGLPVRTDMPAEIYQFMEFLPQQTRTLPSVEYVPHPERHGHGKRA